MSTLTDEITGEGIERFYVVLSSVAGDDKNLPHTGTDGTGHSRDRAIGRIRDITKVASYLPPYDDGVIEDEVVVYQPDPYSEGTSGLPVETYPDMYPSETAGLMNLSNGAQLLPI